MDRFDFENQEQVRSVEMKDSALGPIIKTSKRYNLVEALEQLEEIAMRYPFDSSNQIGITYNGDENVAINERPYLCPGDLRGISREGSEFCESDFNWLIPEFKETVFSRIYQDLSDEGLILGRARLMRLPPKRTYWMHDDCGLGRIHFVLKTNEESYMFFPKEGFYHLKADGHLYDMNAELKHTAFNAGKSDRVHFVISRSIKTPLKRD